MGTHKKLMEITNTPNAKKISITPPEACHVTKDDEILDLQLEFSDDSLFDNLEIDMKDLKFIKK